MFDLQFSSSMQDSCNNATNRFFLARSVLVMLRVFSSIYEAIGVLSSKFSDHPSWLGCQKVIEKHLENTMDLIMGNWRASPSGFLSTKKRVIFEKLRVRKKKTSPKNWLPGTVHNPTKAKDCQQQQKLDSYRKGCSEKVLISKVFAGAAPQPKSPPCSLRNGNGQVDSGSVSEYFHVHPEKTLSVKLYVH